MFRDNFRGKSFNEMFYFEISALWVFRGEIVGLFAVGFGEESVKIMKY